MARARPSAQGLRYCRVKALPNQPYMTQNNTFNLNDDHFGLPTSGDVADVGFARTKVDARPFLPGRVGPLRPKVRVWVKGASPMFVLSHPGCVAWSLGRLGYSHSASDHTNASSRAPHCRRSQSWATAASPQRLGWPRAAGEVHHRSERRKGVSVSPHPCSSVHMSRTPSFDKSSAGPEAQSTRSPPADDGR